MRDPYATHELGLADVARRDPLDDLLNLLIFFQHRDLPAVAPITGSRPRGPPGQKSESDRNCSGRRGDPNVAAGEFGEDVEGPAAVLGRGSQVGAHRGEVLSAGEG